MPTSAILLARASRAEVALVKCPIVRQGRSDADGRAGTALHRVIPGWRVPRPPGHKELGGA
ncbi:MAG: hypothetical protein AAFW01_04615, partial [Pseudomonadota bacterium]